MRVFSGRILTILLIAVACSSDGGSGTTGDIGGTLTIALPAEPPTLFPPLVRGTMEKEIADQIFDALAEIGPARNTVGDEGWTPRLAESWQWSTDSLSITFKLHPQAKWHDGHPVTSADVRFTVDVTKDPKVLARAAGALADVDSVSTPDPRTAVVWFARRSPEQFYIVAHNVVPIPEHILRDADRANLSAHVFGRAPIGTGPFRFVRWEPNTLLEVAADTVHYLGRPKLDRVIWMLNPDVVAALVNVLAGQIDALEIVSPDGMTQIAGQTSIGAVAYSSPNYGYLGFNFRDPANAARPHPLFGDRALRRALVMAIDRKTLLKNVYDSLAWLGSGPFPRGLSTSDTTLAIQPFDSTGADRLLDSLGWKDQNGDGVREKGGRPLRFGITTMSVSAGRRRYAELIQAQLKSHGVQVDVDLAEPAVVMGRAYDGKYDAILHNWGAEPSPSSIRDQWRSPSGAKRGNNLQHYGNPVVDAAIDSALTEPDPSRSRALYRRAYQGIIEDAAGVWLYENRYFMALNKRVQPAISSTDFWWRQLRDWSIRKN
jgi:peptide/nickel transport system substrate-binding protein